MPRKPEDTAAAFLLLPELALIRIVPLRRTGIKLLCEKTSKFEVCPDCATPAYAVYDHRDMTCKDEPIRGKLVILTIRKRRFSCPGCGGVFTEPVAGIGKRKRTTWRYQKALKWATDNFMSLASVRKAYRCSAGFCHKAVQDELKLRTKKRTYPLPKSIGIDEHSIRKPKHKGVKFATIIVDHNNHRVYTLIDSRERLELIKALRKYPGTENVKNVTMDCSTTFRSVVQQVFPNATIIVDRFHVQRFFTRLVNHARKKVTGDDRKNPIRKLVLRNASELEPYERRAMLAWLNQHPEVKEAWQFKEAMRAIYRTKGLTRARQGLKKLLDEMGHSKNLKARNLRKVLLKWKDEILAYHATGLSNGRTEGFNRKAKLCQRAGYGIRSFENYKWKLLNACF